MTRRLLHTPADVLSRVLIAAGVGTDPPDSDPWPVYATDEPDTPDNCITVFDTVGMTWGSTMTDGVQQLHSGAQVRVRGRPQDDPYVKANEVAVALDAVNRSQVTISGTAYLVDAVDTGDVISVGKEGGSGRRVCTVNVTFPVTKLS
jgi:hypothetical protein